MLFVDRRDAGRRLAEKLTALAPDVVVLGLPRGGVPVAFEVARALRAPLDVIMVRRLGLPHQTELAMGAVGEHHVQVLNDPVLRAAKVSARDLSVAERRARAEVAAYVVKFRGLRPPIPLRGRTAVLVDDGIATGSTMRAAAQIAREHGARRVVVAVPVADLEAVAALRDGVADQVVCLRTPSPFFSVGHAYHDFTPVSDEEVVRLLRSAGRPRAVVDPPADPVVPAEPRN